jgi:hypothetical protein
MLLPPLVVALGNALLVCVDGVDVGDGVGGADFFDSAGVGDGGNGVDIVGSGDGGFHGGAGNGGSVVSVAGNDGFSG